MEFINKFMDLFVMFVIYVIVLIAYVKGALPKECLPNDLQGCSCKFTDNSGIIDLRSLSTTDNTPRFKDIKGKDGNLYSFSACNGFTEDTCVNAAMCLREEGYSTKIGDAGQTLFRYSEETSRVTAAYIVRGSVIKVSEVEYICDPNACDPVFTPQGMSTVGQYNFQLTHVCSCPGLCDEHGPTNCSKNQQSSSSLGPGTIALMILFSVLLIYIVGGILYQKVAKKASGTDLIPNKDTWTSLKNLVTTGIMFTFNKCLPKRFQYESVN